MIRQLLSFTVLSLALAACVNANTAAAPEPAPAPFASSALGQFNEPWAMSFLPDGRLLVTEKQGKLKVHAPGGATGDVTGVPDVAYGGQGGLGDVVLHPKFADNGWIYLSYAEVGDDGNFGAAVARAKLVLDDVGGGKLEELSVIWRQVPKLGGRGHYGHRIAFAPNGDLYISSGERQNFTPAQDMKSNLGKIIRLNDDGSLPKDNPFADQGGVAAEVWSLGHRNPLGIAFDASGRLWEIEHGPRGGDEFNLIERGSNYGYPVVSNGDHYDGRDIPDHDTHPEFNAPEISWTPVIAPGDFIFYSGKVFADWQGDAIVAGMGAKALVRIEIEGDTAREAARYDMGERIREIEQGPDGAIYVLEDGAKGRLLKLTPKS